MADNEQWASYSQLATLRSCPQKWNYSYRLKLRKDDPEDVKVELEFGNWWHAVRAGDSIVRGEKMGTLKKAPKEIGTVDDGGPRFIPANGTDRLDEQILDASDRWWATLSRGTQDVWIERLGEGLPERLHSLDARYREQWAAEREQEGPVAVEMGWGRLLPPLPETEGGTDPNTRVVGYVDEVYLDLRRKFLVVRDHKSHKSLSTQTSADDMMDSQLQFYAWGATTEAKEWGLGPIRATAYDRVCSVAPRPPQLTLAGRLAQRAGQPSVSACDLHTYLEWAKGPDGEGVPFPGGKKDGSAAGLYTAEDAVIEKLSTPAAKSTWFQRTLTPLNLNLIKTHLRAAVDSSIYMAQQRERANLSGEAARNLTSACRWCDFARLCRAQMIGGPNGEYDLSTYYLRDASKS